MRERAAAAGVVALAALCCAGPGLATGALGAVVASALTRSVLVALASLGALAAIAVLVVRRR